ncbi:MAG: hypothetical protein GSR78_00040 [Desulfurococcales archaeon]|nr:hypothetical protein [Desulfurococcales archaeon]
MRGSYGSSASMGVAAAAIIHSIVFYILVESYWDELNVFETLGLLLQASNLYAFIVSYMAGISLGDTATYAIVNALTLGLATKIMLSRLLTREGSSQDVVVYFKSVTVAVALAVKPLEYTVLVLWLLFLLS